MKFQQRPPILAIMNTSKKGLMQKDVIHAKQ